MIAVPSDTAEIDNILESTQAIHAKLQEQAVGLEESSATNTQMLHNISTIRERLHETADFAREVGTSTGKGERVVHTSTEAVDRIREASQTIYRVIENVSVVENTSLLAMHAAIEAAHAGSAGRGWGAVIDELESLLSPR